jgi:hypothetical protein
MRKIRELNKKLRDSTSVCAEDLADVSFSERRCGIKDRRKIHTYIYGMIGVAVLEIDAEISKVIP